MFAIMAIIASSSAQSYNQTVDEIFKIDPIQFESSTPTISVESYWKNDGTFVESHRRTAPNRSNWDNFSTTPNTNPYTGSTGYRARDYSIQAENYGSGHYIHKGPRGGQYYYNDSGKKVYVPKR